MFWGPEGNSRHVLPPIVRSAWPATLGSSGFALSTFSFFFFFCFFFTVTSATVERHGQENAHTHATAECFTRKQLVCRIPCIYRVAQCWIKNNSPCSKSSSLTLHSASVSEARRERLERGQPTIQTTLPLTVHPKCIVWIQPACHSQLWIHSENKTSVWTRIRQMNGGQECTQQAGGFRDQGGGQSSYTHLHKASCIQTEGTFSFPFVNE